jgi:hypothetical protein
LAVGPPPVINVQPTNQTVLLYGSATFAVVVTNSQTQLSYQWLKNGSSISGATLSSYTIASVQATNQATYAVQVVNGGGSVTSSNATLTILTAPTITTQPQSQAVSKNDTAILSVTASGTAPLSYQWSLNGSPLYGATSSTLIIYGVHSWDAGNYVVVVTNSAGSVTSAVAVLTMDAPPFIITQPQNQIVNLGQNAAFSIVAIGLAPVTYQWAFNGTNLAGATTSTLSLTNVQATNAGNYSVVLANYDGSTTSSNVTLILNVPPAITTQPLSQSVTVGSNAVFSVAASGTAPFAYQWRFNGTNLAGATSSTLSLTAVQTNNAGIYSVMVTNVAGSVTSSNATLTVNVPPGITTQPLNQAATTGSNAVFSVVPSGTAPFGYQWQFNGTNLVGATSSTLSLISVQTNNAGNYSVVVTNIAGSVTSSVATLTVNVPAFIISQPQGLAVVQNQTAAFSVAASGTALLKYQWRFSGTNLVGSTNATLTITNVPTTKAGSYLVVVTNSWGAVTSAIVTLTVYVPAGISTQPANQALVQGQTTSFSVVASGTAPFSYQWSFNGTNVFNATNATVSVTNVQTTDAGNYMVVVTNIAGSVTSTVASLTVYLPPAITNQPQSLAITQAQMAVFSVGASGTALLKYQWRFSGTNLIGSTNATLTLTNVQATKAGNYVVVVTNTWGSVTSAVAALTVYVPPTIFSPPTNLAVILGQTAAFSVVAAGTSPFGYQWSFNGTNLTGATSSTLSLTGVQTNNAGSYSVVVTNIAGAVTSAVVALTVYVPPAITTQPQSLTLLQGQTAMFSVAAAGSAPFTYQWYFNGAASGGASSNPTNTLTNINAGNAGNYMVVVAGPGGSVTSSVATLTIYGIQTQPQNLAVVLGQNAAFSVVPSGPAPLGYQWFFNGTAAVSGTAASLNLTNAQPTQAGSYLVVLSTPVGSITSQVATLTVNVPAMITNQPQSLTLTQGQTAVFSVVAGGTGPLNYQWHFGGTNLSGATNATLTLANVQTNNVGNYFVIVTNSWGSITSAVVTLTVLVPAWIATQPANQAVILGQNALFSVGAGGDAPLSYQWSFNGTNSIISATNSTLALNNVQTNQAGNYTVLVANNWGSVTSSIATLTVYLPTVITNQPDSVVTNAGNTVVFSVGAAGSTPFTYRWYFNGVAVGGGAGAGQNRTLPNVGPPAAGNYWVVVSGNGGSATSAVATLTVYVPPTITSQPANVTVVQGQTASFSVSSAGTAPFSYQWNLNGTNISAATNSLLTLTNVQATQAGNCYVVITNYGGSITSAVRTLTVNVPAFITNQPQSLTVTQGQTATFTVGAGGTPNLTYQWYFNSANAVPGSTNSTLTINGAITNNAGSYIVVVKNNYGSITSAVVTLTVLVPAWIATQPANQAVILGQNALFSVGAGGDAPLSYQWSFNGTNTILDATNSTLALTNVQTTDGGNYSVTVANNWGSVTSTNALLIVYLPTVITNQPDSLAMNVGQTALFSVGASGSAPFTYQWYFNGVSLGSGSGAQTATLTVGNLVTNNAGNYTVVVSGPGGAVTSSAATLTVYVPPSISTQPANQSAVLGQNASFSVIANGTSPYAYQWFFYSTNSIFGATNSTLNLTNVQTTDAGSYSVVVTNLGGSVTSSNATLTVNVPPSITTQPLSQAVTAGQNASFNVAATGTGPLYYQWNFQGTNLVGATNASLTVANAQVVQAGSYTVMVTNCAGSVASAASLVVTNPIITLASANSAMTPDGFNFQISIPAGLTYIILASPDLVNWTPIFTNVAATSNIVFTDASATNSSSRYYRVLTP